MVNTFLPVRDIGYARLVPSSHGQQATSDTLDPLTVCGRWKWFGNGLLQLCCEWFAQSTAFGCFTICRVSELLQSVGFRKRNSTFSLAGQMFAACGKGGKECLVTIDRFSWTSQECWRHQSDWRSFNNYIYLPYWSHDKALLDLDNKAEKRETEVLWGIMSFGRSRIKW